MPASRSLRRVSTRAALAVALALPATAIAAPATDEPRATASGTGDEAAPGVVELAAAVGGAVLADDAVSGGQGPYNPVAAPVDYGTAINTFGGGGMRSHEGQDMFAPVGTPLVSPAATTVLETGTDGGRGNWAALYDPAADRTYVYMHMEEPATVKAGQGLNAGDVVGPLGCTGSCDGAHLHFEIRAGKDPYGRASDPIPEISKWEPPPAG